jgi:predicted LPLAT superfamily acyltransferase
MSAVPTPRWAGMAEAGSASAIRLMAWLHHTFGRRLSTALLYPITAYFFLRRRVVRRGSQSYLRALFAYAPQGGALDHAPTRRDVFRHVYHFAINLLDRTVMWGGGFQHFEMRHQGSEILFRLARERRGAILLGAHLGSYDMPRVLAGRSGLVLNIVMFTAHAARINEFFARLDPTSTIRVLRLDPASVRAGFAIKACLDRGELVGILADRVTPGERDRPVAVPFLGRPAMFPLSPFLLGGVLGCPLLASLCVRTGAATYQTVVRTLWEGGRVPGAERERVAREVQARYVQLLEEQCVETPYEWFNLYDFWEPAAAPGVG